MFAWLTLFIPLRALAGSTKLCYLTTDVSNGVREPYLLLTNSSFTLRFSESQEMFHFGKICQNRETNI